MVQLDRRQQIMILLLAGIILFSGGYRFAQLRERAAAEVRPTLDAVDDNKTREFSVHVVGAVLNPGVYQLPQGSRIIDAVNKAGPLGEADLDSLRLAAKVTDGQDILVPLKSGGDGSTDIQTGSAAGQSALNKAGSPGTTGRVNINTANLSQLDTLPGIGPALAQRIIQYREANGPFQEEEDLKNVSGIGDKNFENLRELITVW